MGKSPRLCKEYENGFTKASNKNFIKVEHTIELKVPRRYLQSK